MIMKVCNELGCNEKHFCSQCNSGIGFLNDDCNTLESAKMYLTKHSELVLEYQI